ncbi:MAG: secondary thiamine-phosphate synthase enzyme YjbQ [Burkholderiaceae bacterium]|jgi:secondary thiamine-phosphate synthase enzyme|nr:secondary thiamine-phosphate synthase enzyme YjbQ [Burkholderiaceae bacterium]
MQQLSNKINVKTSGRRLYDITPQVLTWARNSSLSAGLLTLYVQHTSASILINENYDSDVLVDMESFFARLVPDGDRLFIHTSEGPDDMPAHIRSALTQTSISIPFLDGKVALGTWQGIFLYEHRLEPHSRNVLLHLIAE